MLNELPKSYGAYVAFEIKTDTRSFDQVDAAGVKAGIKHEHKPTRPTVSQAISRAIACLMRICMSSIAFPGWSKHSTWTEDRPVFRMVGGKMVRSGVSTTSCSGRNPNYSLKITQVKQALVDASTTWRINIANRNKAGENMGHVLSVTYDPVQGLYFTKGTDQAAFDGFGKEIQEIVNAEYLRFATHYNDEDIRSILDSELADMQALKVIKNTNRFIAHTQLERAKALYQFAKDVGQEVSWLGLDNEPMTRDSLLKDLQASILGAMDDYEIELDAKLNPKGLERKRGEKRREQMHSTAMGNIDKIMASAEYHAQVLGCMAEGIMEKRDALRAKAMKLLTLTGDEAPVFVAPVDLLPVKEAQPGNVVSAEKAFE